MRIISKLGDIHATQYDRLMHTTTDISTRLGVNAATIRRWADQYEQYMSAESHTGDARQYSDDDLLLLWSIRRWRQLGYALPEIGERLAKGERTTDEIPPLESVEPPKAVMVSESVHTAALAEIRRLDGERARLLIERDAATVKNETLNERIAGLEREIGELQGTLKERPAVEHWIDRLDNERRKWLIALAAAVILAVVATAILLLAGRGI